MSPLIVPVNGHNLIAAELPSAFAFNLIFALGCVFSIGCIALSLATKNYTFEKRSE
ncbi:MAG: hypothetical protein M1587_08380 [Thaumarchaeota archaeon]|nr:hypothetical protein [Nitrososphaerota archaeon]